MINWGDIVHQEYATPVDVEDDVIQEVDRTNAVYTRGGNIEKIDDFKYDKVYFGSPYKMSNPMKLDGPLFVSPFPGIASIFSVRPQKDAMKNKYGIPVEKVTNRGYDEWNRNKIDELKKGPIKELHVRLKGITDMEPIEDIVHGYLGEITITDELKEHIYQSAKMHKVFEYCIDHIDSVSFSDIKEVEIKMYITGETPRKTVGESFSLDDVEDDFFIESAFSYDKTMEACQELHKEWSKFGYGIPINGKLTNVSSGEEFCKNYRFLSPEDFEKYNGGVCWDFVEWGAKFLRSKGVTFHQYYIQTDTPPNYDTHTFIVCQCGDKFIYPESAFGIIEKDINGVGTFESLPEIFNYVASKIFECNNNRSRFNEFKFSVQEYTQTPNYGCTCEEYMDFMKKHAHLIFEGIAHPIDHAYGQDAVPRNIQEAKLTTTKRDKLKDSEFGIPEKRTFPLNDKNHVEAAVRMFPHADASDKEALAKRILRKAHEFGMDTSGWDSINKYVVQEGMFDSIELAEIPYVTASSGHKPVTVDESQMNPFALFDKIPINDYTVNRYKNRTDDMAIGLKHLRVNDNVRGFIWLNQQDEVVGYVAVEKQDIGPFIIALELSPKYQGKGLGKALLEFAENYLGGRYLSVSKNNTHAFEMYKKCGWVVYDETPYMYFMKKDDNIVQPVVQEGAWQDIKNGVNPKSKKLFFHVSMDTKMNGKTLKPRIPTYLTKKGSVSDTYKEDSTIPRVCFSPSIEGCLNAIISAQKNLRIVGEKMFVYIPEKPISEYKIKTNKEIIKEKLVFDANATGEIWILEPVKLKLYGVIIVDQVKNIRDKPTINGDPHCRCDYKWHWAVTPKYVDRTLEYQVTYDDDDDSSKKKKTTKE